MKEWAKMTKQLIIAHKFEFYWWKYKEKKGSISYTNVYLIDALNYMVFGGGFFPNCFD